MRAVVQRVSSASVTVNSAITGRIDQGLMILLGVHESDNEKDADWLAAKISKLRIFNDADGKMNLSCEDVGGSYLVVSQFTLYGNAQKGNRPSFIESAGPEKGEQLYDYFCQSLGRLTQKNIQTGIFGAMMEVELINEGPVTIILESKT